MGSPDSIFTQFDANTDLLHVFEIKDYLMIQCTQACSEKAALDRLQCRAERIRNRDDRISRIRNAATNGKKERPILAYFIVT